jgi:hypothetical protein
MCHGVSTVLLKLEVLGRLVSVLLRELAGSAEPSVVAGDPTTAGEPEVYKVKFLGLITYKFIHLFFRLWMFLILPL